MSGGAWIVYSWDHGPDVHEIYQDEIDALRSAVKSSAHVAFIEFGQDVREAVSA